MDRPAYGTARHLSIVWAVTLAALTLFEWRNLERDPLGREILSPFIHREITVIAPNDGGTADIFTDEPELAQGLRYEVEFHFNGPLFLLCFFGPIGLFHGISLAIARLRKG